MISSQLQNRKQKNKVICLSTNCFFLVRGKIENNKDVIVSSYGRGPLKWRVIASYKESFSFFLPQNHYQHTIISIQPLPRGKKHC